jgi:hypothetical protein
MLSSAGVSEPRNLVETSEEPRLLAAIVCELQSSTCRLEDTWRVVLERVSKSYLCPKNETHIA